MCFSLEHQLPTMLKRPECSRHRQRNDLLVQVWRTYVDQDHPIQHNAKIWEEPQLRHKNGFPSFASITRQHDAEFLSSSDLATSPNTYWYWVVGKAGSLGPNIHPKSPKFASSRFLAEMGESPILEPWWFGTADDLPAPRLWGVQEALPPYHVIWDKRSFFRESGSPHIRTW